MGLTTPLNILLVDDDEVDVKIALRAFHSTGKVKMHVAYGGEEALEYLLKQGKNSGDAGCVVPDLILVDIKMPQMSGIELLKALKREDRFHRIPIIMLTSSKDKRDVIESYDQGAAGYIQKPVSYEEFLEVVADFNHYWQNINQLPNRIM